MTTAPGPSALRLIITLFISTLLLSCGGGNPAQEGNGAGIAFRLKWPVAKSVGSASSEIPLGVVTVRMSVSGPGMTTISKEFEVSPTSPRTGSIDKVPVGSGRSITFQGLASNGDLIYQAVVSSVTLVQGTPYDCGTVTMTQVANPSTPAIPTDPAGLSANAVSASQIDIAWVDNASNETSYMIERKTGGGGAYVLIATVAANDTIYNDTALSASTIYYYRVRAGNAVGSSGYSNEANATTSVLVPVSTYSISGTIAGMSALDHATVTRSGNGTTTTPTGSDGSYGFSGVQNGNYTLIPANTNYTFDPPRLEVTVNGTNQPAINFAATEVSTVPVVPSGLSAAAASSSLINLAWVDNANNETGYQIERMEGSIGAYTQIATVAANVTTYSDSSLSASTAYYYRVRATNFTGASGYSNVANAITPANSYRISGTITNLDGRSAAVTLSKDGGIIEVGNTVAGNYSFIVQNGSYTLTPALAEYIFSPQTQQLTVNGANLSAMNFVAAAVPTIPSAPSNLTAIAASSSLINLAWLDHANNENGYKIERKEGQGGSYSEIATVAATTYTYKDTTLSASTAYFYRVRATNSIGDSGYSNEANATTYSPATLIVPELVDVPAGISTYGGVTVGAFRIGKYEVTQREYLAVMGKNPSNPLDPANYSACGPDCPVENISWNEIQNFIFTLNGLSGISYRLPTEAEWQYAAQSGGNGEVYSGGSDVNAVAWYSGNSGGITHPVGSIKPGSILSGSNGLGIYDMSGNVAEWVNDFYGTSSNHVIRGGSAFVGATFVTTTSRGSSAPSFRDKFLGFRLAAPAL